MPVPNPLKITKTQKISRRLADDMPSRNDLLFNKEIVTEVSRMSNPNSLLNFFGKLFGATPSQSAPEQEGKMFDIVGKGTAMEYIRMRKYRETMYPAKVVDASTVPDRLVAGANFEVAQDKFVGEAGSYVQLKDQQTMLMAVSYRSSGSNNHFNYTYQLIGMAGETAPGSLLNMDSPINYGFGNSVGEGSLTGNTIVDEGDRYTDTYNVLPVMRFTMPRTGNALADETFKFSVVESINGEQVAMDYVTDLPLRFCKSVFSQLDRALMHSRANFDIPNKRIINRSSSTRYPERPSFAGMYQMWDLAPYQWQAYKSAPASEGISLINNILAFKHNELGAGKEYMIYCSGAGRQWIKDVFEAIVIQKQYKVEIVVDAAGKLGGGTIGWDMDTYVTRDGRVTIVDIGYALNQWGGEYNLSAYNNVGYTPRSNYLYIQPVGAGAQAKKPATLYGKEGNGFSRAFVFGISQGMTGRNGLGAKELMSMQEEGIRKMSNNQSLRVDSTADIDELHLLSQICPFMDTDQMSRIQLI